MFLACRDQPASASHTHRRLSAAGARSVQRAKAQDSCSNRQDYRQKNAAILAPRPSSSRQIRASRSCSLHRSSGHWLRPDRATLGNQIIGAVAEHPLDHSFPSGKMKKRPARVGADELVPPMLISGPKRPYRDRDLGSIHEVINGTDSTPSCRKRRSMRAHLKSPSRCRSRCSVSPRLR